MYNTSLKILRLLPPELSHTITIIFLKYFKVRQKNIEDPILAQHLMGLDFANPIGLAAGFDKNGEIIKPISNLGFGFDLSKINTPDDKKNSIFVYCLVSANSKTGVEMEALSGVSSALLAIYDLSKIVEPNLKISNTKLLVKSGGKRGLWINPDGMPDKIKNILKI